MGGINFSITANGGQAINAINSVKKSAHNLASDIGGNLKGQLAAAFSVGAIIAATDHVINLASEIQKASDVLNVTTEDFQALKIATREAGVDVAVLEKGFDKLENAASKAIGGDNKMKSIFKTLGISDDQVKNLDKVALLQKVMQGTKSMSVNERQQTLEGLGMKASVADAFGAMKDSLSDFESFKNRLKANGQIADASTIADLANFKDDMADITDSFVVALMPAISNLIPLVIDFAIALGGLMNKFTAVAAKMNEYKGDVADKIVEKGWGDALEDVFDGSIKWLVGQTVAGANVFTKGGSNTDKSWRAYSESAIQQGLEGIYTKEHAEAIRSAGKKADADNENHEQDIRDALAQSKVVRAQKEANKKKSANRVTEVTAAKSLLDNEIKGGSSLLKVGALGGVDVSYRLHRLSQQANDFLKKIEANTRPIARPTITNSTSNLYEVK